MCIIPGRLWDSLDCWSFLQQLVLENTHSDHWERIDTWNQLLRSWQIPGNQNCTIHNIMQYNFILFYSINALQYQHWRYWHVTCEIWYYYIMQYNWVNVFVHERTIMCCLMLPGVCNSIKIKACKHLNNMSRCISQSSSINDDCKNISSMTADYKHIGVLWWG